MSEMPCHGPYSDAVRAMLDRPPRLFIANRWVEPEEPATIPVVDPSIGQEIGRIADAGPADVDHAVAAARRAFDEGPWPGMAPLERERLIHRLADLIESHADELAELEAVDNGKPRALAAAVDLPAAVAMLRYMAGWASKLGGEAIEPAGAPAGSFHAYVRREPVGVAAQIVPWNFPLLMAVSKIAPALVAGCTLVLKPAEQTSLSALRLADLVLAAGFPPGVVNIVTGTGATAGDALVRHPGVDKVAFTGSTPVGKLICRNAAETLKRVTLELGGKSPVIVMPDVDVAETAAQAATAIFFNAGQVCVAGSRLYAHRAIFDRLLAELAAVARRDWQPRPALDPEARMGPVVSHEQRARVLRYVEQGRAAGATIAFGGDCPEGAGFFVNPTMLLDVRPDMAVVQEEIFGPVIVAQRFDDLDEAARSANETVYGLGASVWTRDASVIHRLAARIRAGTVWGNCHGMLDPALPFGGFWQSGLGREHARAGVEAYTELKTVIVKL